MNKLAHKRLLMILILNPERIVEIDVSVDHFDPIRRETFTGVKILGALGDRMYY
jgi:hypothetical protein